MSRAPTNANGDLEEADEVGEDEEGSGVVDPLQETKEDEGAAVDDEAGREDPVKKQLPHWRRLPPLIQGGVISKKVKVTRAHPQGQGEALHGTFYGMASLMRTIHLDRIWLGKDVAGMPRRGLTNAGWRVVMSAA